MFPLTRVPLWYRFFEPQPYELEHNLNRFGRCFSRHCSMLPLRASLKQGWGSSQGTTGDENSPYPICVFCCLVPFVVVFEGNQQEHRCAILGSFDPRYASAYMRVSYLNWVLR